MSFKTCLLLATLSVATQQVAGHNFCFYTLSKVVTENGKRTEDSTTYHYIEAVDCNHSIQQVSKAAQYKQKYNWSHPGANLDLKEPIMTPTQYGPGFFGISPTSKYVFCTDKVCSGCDGIRNYQKIESSGSVTLTLDGYQKCNNDLGVWRWNGNDII